MKLKLGDGVKLEVQRGLYAIYYVERIIWGPDIALLSNDEWYSLGSYTFKHGRSVYQADESIGNIERATLFITPRKKDLEAPFGGHWSIDNRPLEQIRDDEIIR